MPKSFAELKEMHPALWKKACKKYAAPAAREQYFRALVLTQKARQQEQRKKQQERRRRTRALILFALAVLEDMFSRKGKENTVEYIHTLNGKLKAKEGGAEVDYLPYLLAELQELQEKQEIKEV